LQQRIGAIDYVECSALTSKGIYNLFDTAVRNVIADANDVSKDASKLQKGCCTIA
jgi:hypothetical protein